MRAVIQRVTSAKVKIGARVAGEITNGLVVLIAAEERDTEEDTGWLSRKIVRMRIFGDDQGLMNRSVQDIDGGILVVSQFTLFASTKKGNRPSFIRSAKPEVAIPLYNSFILQLETELGKPVARGEFGAEMIIQLTNNGPVTIMIDSKQRE